MKVTYQIDTGHALERTVPDGEDAIAAAPPATLEGYTFVGWRQDNSAEKKVLSEFIISSEEPVTLYAVFKKQMTIGLIHERQKAGAGYRERQLTRYLPFNGAAPLPEMRRGASPYHQQRGRQEYWVCSTRKRQASQRSSYGKMKKQKKWDIKR